MRASGKWFWLARAIVALLLAGGALLASMATSRAAEGSMRWRWSNPKPHGGNVVDMAYSAALGVAIQVAELGQIYSSGDFNLWIPRESGTTNDLRAVAFMGSRILITGQNGTVLYADSLDDFKPGTLSNGSTADWLEGVTASPTLAVAVGDNGAIYTSADGVNWQKRSSANQWLRGVTYGGGVFVAVGEAGKIITSLNGTTWTTRASGTGEHFNRVSFATGRFTAVAENGACFSSTNSGVNWFAEATGALNDLFYAATSGSNRFLVGDSEVRVQNSGGPWTNELSKVGGPVPWTYYSATRTPDFVLIAGRTGLMEEGYGGAGAEPVTWRSGDDSIRNWLWDVTCPTNLYVAVGDRATVMTSLNGVDWKLELVPEAVTNAIFLGVGGNTNLLIAVGDRGAIAISPNVVESVLMTNQIGGEVVVAPVGSNSFGVVWSAPARVTTNDLQGVGASSDLFVVTGAGGTILTSVDGSNWVAKVSPTNRFLSGVTAWPGGWVATGDDGAIVTSVDGKSWSVVGAVTTNWLYRVRFAGGRLIAVGQNGTILTSTNATAWSRQTSGTTKWLNDVTFVDGSWFAVGNSGTVLKSTNAVNWSQVGTLTRKNLYGATTDSRQLITVGVEGLILRSPIVAETNAVKFLSFDRIVTGGGSGYLAQNLYLFGGRPDQRFTLDYRSTFDTNVWLAGPELEFLDGSGTLFFLETITTTNPPLKEFYRTTLIAP
ncbi:MAG: hypothetical protein IPK15_10765 [Verrucomicrobia bacterium]|nr:hypothetical protein [Verrucomicrobiota bacterium]